LPQLKAVDADASGRERKALGAARDGVGSSFVDSWNHAHVSAWERRQPIDSSSKQAFAERLVQA